ncbi:unnamed protein product [Clavelina lepadiformis]|uniref:TIL domain-containing protein n=1 Tax=Clavelina lepadiformis TaxID=159417 RepID=A0ABP0GUL9_CLALP
MRYAAQCEGGMVWSECSRSCEASCGAIHEGIPCSEECVPGCACPDGQVLGYEGTCIAVQNCPCFFDGEKYLPSDSHMLVTLMAMT